MIKSHGKAAEALDKMILYVILLMVDKKIAELIDKLTRQPESLFDSVDKLLRYFGYKTKAKGSSHLIYRKKGCPPIQIVTRSGRHVSKHYIKKAIDILSQQGLL